MSPRPRVRSLDVLIELAANAARDWHDVENPIPYLYGVDDDDKLTMVALALTLTSYAEVQDALYVQTAVHRMRAAVYVAEVWTARDLRTPDEIRGVVEGTTRLKDRPSRVEEVMILAQDIEGNRRDLVMPIERRGKRRRKHYLDPRPLDDGRRYPFRLFAFKVTYAPESAK